MELSLRPSKKGYPMHSNISVVGERELILSFKALGVPVVPVEDATEAEEAVKRLVEEKCSIILVTERFALKMKSLLEELRKEPDVTITPIPTSGGSEGFALEELKAVLRKAVGVDIFG
jgi:V/A-type H+-transporting ATPase subunit F